MVGTSSMLTLTLRDAQLRVDGYRRGWKLQGQASHSLSSQRSTALIASVDVFASQNKIDGLNTVKSLQIN